MTRQLRFGRTTGHATGRVTAPHEGPSQRTHPLRMAIMSQINIINEEDFILEINYLNLPENDEASYTSRIRFVETPPDLSDVLQENEPIGAVLPLDEGLTLIMKQVFTSLFLKPQYLDISTASQHSVPMSSPPSATSYTPQDLLNERFSSYFEVQLALIHAHTHTGRTCMGIEAGYCYFLIYGILQKVCSTLGLNMDAPSTFRISVPHHHSQVSIGTSNVIRWLGVQPTTFANKKIHLVPLISAIDADAHYFESDEDMIGQYCVLAEDEGETPAEI
ncbi:hypothetical protein BDZ89DRAFT_1049926 [Hymenopellis radicata]|nr:hypothetical protein BDZ89DRAFT_1049926 [Hymenopellis radicata]